MMVFTSDVPSQWVWGIALVWLVASFVYVLRVHLLRLPETSESFPFSFKQFLVMGLGLCAAVGLYFASFLVAGGAVSALGVVTSSVVPSSDSQEWFALAQIISLILGLGSIQFVRSFLPDDALPLVVGASNSFKKLIKGAALGVLVLPLILVTTWLVGVIVSLFSSEPKVPQLALEIFQHIPHSGPLFWGMIGVAVILAPYVEEMIFRGFLQGFLNGLVHPALSVLITAAAFALFHYSSFQKGSNLEIMAGLFLFAVIASNLRVREDSIVASVGYHAAFNAMSLALLFGWM
jgi:membrane protease YdiL (CAAX protease family)